MSFGGNSPIVFAQRKIGSESIFAVIARAEWQPLAKIDSDPIA
jgi:hypothetical protein